MADSSDYALRAARWAGLELTDAQLGRLDTFASWLTEEAIPAGGLGPREGTRVWQRHIADSLTFAGPLAVSAVAPVVDVGSGVGLPGIPLAIALPDQEFWLLDRGGRRTRLVERFLRMVDIPNALVITRDIKVTSGLFAGLLFRASLPVSEALEVTARLLTKDGAAVLGLSKQLQVPAETLGAVEQADAHGLITETIRLPDEVLDGPSWLLKMAHRG